MKNLFFILILMFCSQSIFAQGNIVNKDFSEIKAKFKEITETKNIFYDSSKKTEKNLYWVSVSLGYGSNHGGSGFKFLFSERNIDGSGDGGLFVNIGYFKEEVFFGGGFQFPYKHFYILLGAGCIAVEDRYEYSSFNGQESSSNEREIVTGITLTGGYRFSFGSDDRFFVDLGLGYSWALKNMNKGKELKNDYTGLIAGDLAIGVRF